jgi:hypothetical protein
MDTFQNYTFEDIEKAISVSANYLAALGLSTYTENLGGLLPELIPNPRLRFL